MITFGISTRVTTTILMGLVAWSLYSGSLGHAQGPGASGGAPPPAVTAGTTVVGIVVAIDPESKQLILRTEQEEEKRLTLDIDAFVKDKNIEVGDEVEVVVKPDGRIRSLTKRPQ